MSLARVALAIASVGLLTACSNLEGESPRPDASAAVAEATRSAAPAASSEPASGTPDPTGGAEGPCTEGRLCTGLLRPGTYTTNVVGSTSLSLTVETDWHAEVSRGGEYFSIFYAGDIPTIIGGGSMDGEVFTDPCSEETTATIEPTAQAFMDWLVSHPAVEAGQPEPVTLGDASGLRVELSAFKAEPCPMDGEVPPELILLWRISSSDVFLFVDNTTAILYALEIGDELVIINAETIGDPDPWYPVVEPVLESIEITLD